MWPDPLDTRELLQRASDADPVAVDRLLDRHRDPLRKMIELRLDRAVSRRVDASDIAQGVLLEASRRLSDYLRDPSVPFHLWLRQIARDHMIDAHRRHRLATRRSVDRENHLPAASPDGSTFDPGHDFRDGELTPAAAAMRGELEHRLVEAIHALGGDDAEVLLMRHFEQLTNSEVARALGLSEAAAGMRYVRALRRLRAALGDSPSLGGLA